MLGQGQRHRRVDAPGADLADDDEVIRVRVQGGTDVLVDGRVAVERGGVEVVDAKLYGAPQDGARRCRVQLLELHRAVPDPGDLVRSECDGAAGALRGHSSVPR